MEDGGWRRPLPGDIVIVWLSGSTGLGTPMRRADGHKVTHVFEGENFVLQRFCLGVLLAGKIGFYSVGRFLQNQEVVAHLDG